MSELARRAMLPSNPSSHGVQPLTANPNPFLTWEGEAPAEPLFRPNHCFVSSAGASPSQLLFNLFGTRLELELILVRHFSTNRALQVFDLGDHFSVRDVALSPSRC